MYDPSLTDPTSTNDSFWASESPPFTLDGPPTEPADSTYDVAIVGGGLTGISTAYHLAQEADLSVCLLEAGRDRPRGLGMQWRVLQRLDNPNTSRAAEALRRGRRPGFHRRAIRGGPHGTSAAREGPNRRTAAIWGDV